MPVLLIPEQRGKARIRIKSRQAQPVDRAVPTHQPGGLAVSYQGVIFDRTRHGSLLMARMTNLR